MLMQNVGGQIQIGFIMGKVEVAYCEYSLSLTEKKKHPIPSFSIGSSPVADRCFVTLLAKKREQISANFNKQIANFRFRRKIGEISMHVLF